MSVDDNHNRADTLTNHANASRVMLIGTSHVSPESVAQIRTAIDKYHPTIVCVELDRGRLSALINKQKPSYSPKLILQLGVGGYLFALIAGFVQRKLGNLVGTTPGHDMLTAVTWARERKISVALIDRPIEQTMQQVSRAFGPKTIWAFVCDFFAGIFMPTRTKRKLGLEGFDLSKAPSERFVRAALQHMERRYPALYSALLLERNTYMVERVAKLLELNPDAKILVVVGAAHVPGMQEELRNHYKASSERVLV